jgi:outer membrane receptor protein involved in Fe transport
MKVTKSAMHWLGYLAGSWLCATSAAAQPLAEAGSSTGSELDLFKLDSLVNATVVTASGGEEEDRAVAAATIYTIPREEILQHGYTTVAEALATVPGLYVIDDLVLPSLSVRGINGGLNAGTRLVKLMIDGNTVAFRPEQSAFLGLEFIPIDAIERIEVAKGPLSAVYGANAFVATINVITRRSQDGTLGALTANLTYLRQPGFSGSAFLSYGSARGYVMAAIGGGRLDRSGLTVPKTLSDSASTGVVHDRATQNDITQPVSAVLLAGVRSQSLGELSLHAGLQRLDSVGQFRVNSLLTESNRIALVNLWSTLRYEKNWSKVGLSASTALNAGQPLREYELQLAGNSNYSFRPNYDYLSSTSSVAISYSPFGQKLSFRVGGELEFAQERVAYYTQVFRRSEGVHQPGDAIDLIEDRPRDRQYLGGAGYLSVTSAPFTKRLKGLRLSGDLRIDKITFGPITFDPQVSFRAAVAYRFTPLIVAKVVAGQAFQMPSGTLLFSEAGFGNRNNIIGAYEFNANKTLQPQKSNIVELSLSAVVLKHWALEASAYSQRILDKVEFVSVGGDFVAKNLTPQASFGFEALSRLLFGRFSAYGWLCGHFDVELNRSVAVRNPPPLYPNWQGLLGLDLDVPEVRLHANAQVRLVGPRGASPSNVLLNNEEPYTLPGYGVLDLTLSTQALHPLGPTADTRLVLTARNLGPTRWAEPGNAGFDLPVIGPSFHLALKQSF